MIRPFGVTACIVALLLHVLWGLYVVASRWTGMSWMGVGIIAMLSSVPLLAAYGLGTRKAWSRRLAQVFLSFYALTWLSAVHSALQSQRVLPLLLPGAVMCMYAGLLGELRGAATKHFLTPEEPS